MAGYQPTYIQKYESGLIQSRVNSIIPQDAFPVLENAYIWRERIKRKQGYQLLGRLRRLIDDGLLGTTLASPWTFNLYSDLVPSITPEPQAEIQAGSVVITINPTTTTGLLNAPGYTNATDAEVFSTAHGLLAGSRITIGGVVVVPGSGDATINNEWVVAEVPNPNSFKLGTDSHDWGVWQSGGTWTFISGGISFTDQGNGTLTSTTPGNSGIIDYISGQVILTHTAGVGAATIVDYAYYPTLPVMGLLSRELNNINNEDTIAFDTRYAYIFNEGYGWEEWIPGTTWTGTDYNFFWATNYWVNTDNAKLFWVTNFSGTLGDPIRYTDGATWTDFTPQITAPTGTNEQLYQCLALLPFRSRLCAFNTLEGTSLAGSVAKRQRIRWAAIGNPLLADAWRDDIRGKGGFLDIPTAEDIVSVGYVRDNLVIYCESSTWQLRYTGRSISPFQIEKVNTEFGAESTFSLIAFDTSLVGIGDKGIIECDSFKSNRIDIKIPDLVFQFQNEDNGPKRVYGIRDFYNRLAFWIYPYSPSNGVYPDRRLVYNYENDSWAIFTDSLTCLGEYQPQNARTWEYSEDTWEQANYPWIASPPLFPNIVGGNQQGFVFVLDQQTNNEAGLTIQGILGQDPLPTVIKSVNHNLQNSSIIRIVDIPTGTHFDTLNNHVFGINVIDADSFELFTYDPISRQFSDPQVNSPGDYPGGGMIEIRDNFIIQSKKFNYLDQAQTIQFGYCDIHANTNENDLSAMSLNVYADYADEQPVNSTPQNAFSDPFFNVEIPLTQRQGLSNTKAWQRVYAQARGAFVTLEYTFTNEQMTTAAQESEVEIDLQILWMRPAGNQIPQGY